MKLFTWTIDRIHICNKCGYSTKKFHHLPCKKCNSYKFVTKRFRKKLHIAFHKEFKYPQINITVEVLPPLISECYDYITLCNTFREYRYYELNAKHHCGQSIIDTYRRMQRIILKQLRMSLKDK